MIKIQEHLNRADVVNFLDQMADNHWDALNPPLASGKGLKQKSLIEKCRKYKKESTLKRYIKKYAQNNNAIALRHKVFFSFLLANKCAQLKRIIIAKPNEYAAIIGDVFAILQSTDLYTGIPGNYSQTAFGSLLTEVIFNYSAFRGSEFCKKLFTKLGFDSATCPYCNDNKVTIVKLKSNSSTKNKLKAYLDLDHFYPKYAHPFFALSFFNLIPTCHDCNSADKGDKLFTIETHIHPYCEAFDDFYTFKFSLTALLGDPIDEIDILKSTLKPLDKTLDDLNLVDRYSTYLPQVQKLVKYFSDYNHYIGTADESVFTDAIFQLNGGIPKQRNEILKSQAGKMNRDTLKQIDITNILNLA